MGNVRTSAAAIGGMLFERQHLFALEAFVGRSQKTSGPTSPGDRLPKIATHPIDPQLPFGFCTAPAGMQRLLPLADMNWHDSERRLPEWSSRTERQLAECSSATAVVETLA